MDRQVGQLLPQHRHHMRINFNVPERRHPRIIAVSMSVTELFGNPHTIRETSHAKCSLVSRRLDEYVPT